MAQLVPAHQIRATTQHRPSTCPVLEPMERSTSTRAEDSTKSCAITHTHRATSCSLRQEAAIPTARISALTHRPVLASATQMVPAHTTTDTALLADRLATARRLLYCYGSARPTSLAASRKSAQASPVWFRRTRFRRPRCRLSMRSLPSALILPCHRYRHQSLLEGSRAHFPLSFLRYLHLF